MKMKRIDGHELDVVGSVLLSHKRTGKQKYFIVYKNYTDKRLVTCQTSNIVGMTQKKAKELRRVLSDVRIDMVTEKHGYV